LSSISKSLSGMTVEGLKRRVARRFSVIGPKNDFVVRVNGAAIGPEDRAYHNALQYEPLAEFIDHGEFPAPSLSVVAPGLRRAPA